MKTNPLARILALSLALMLILSLYALGAGGEAADLPMLKYSFSPYDLGNLQLVSPEDVLTQYLEERFKISLGDVVQRPQDSNMRQTLAMWIAAGTVPDVVEVQPTDITTLATSGEFAPLTEDIRNMPNYLKCYPEELWPRSNRDGEQYLVGRFGDYRPEYWPIPIEEDPFRNGPGGHGLWVREDILAELGYTFTPLMDIKAEYTDNGVKPPVDSFKIEPAIDSPDKLYELLTNIKGLNLQVNGLDVIPLTLMGWQIHHFGCIFDFGHWRIDDNGEVAGYMGTPGAREYLQYVNKIYNEGLLDKDYIVQGQDMYDEKVTMGRAAMGFTGGNFTQLQQALMDNDPEAVIRIIPWPKKYENLGWFDAVTPEAWSGLMINKNMAPENIERLTQFWDWLYSDEGQDMISWGPESAGLWKMVDGQKMWATPEIESEIRDHDPMAEFGRSLGKYGLYESHYIDFNPLLNASATGPNYHSWRRSYPAKIDINQFSQTILAVNGVDLYGRSCSSDGGSEIVAGVDNWWWSQFLSQDMSKILNAKSEDDFNKAFDEIYAEFLEKTDYEEAREIMVQYFKDFPPFN